MPGDASRREGARVHPCAVMISVQNERGAVGYDRVEFLACRQAAGKQVHGPSRAEDPGVAGVRGGVTADQLEVRLPTVALGAVAAEPIEPCRGCVDVGILKRREQHLAVKLDDLRPRSDQWPD